MFHMELLNAIREPLVEMDQRLFFLGSVLPGALVFVTLVGVGLARRKKATAWPRWLPALLFAGAFVFAFASVHALNSVTWWPSDGAKRILHGVFVIALAGAAAELLPGKVRGLYAPLVFTATLVALSLPLLPMIDIEGLVTFCVMVVASFVACAVLATSMAGAQALCPGWRVPLLATSAPFAASFVAYYGSVATLGQMAGGVTAILSASAAAGIFVRRQSLRVTGWLTLFAPVVIALAGARAYAYTPGPIWGAILALAASLPALACVSYKARTNRPWLTLTIQLALTGVMTLGAIWIAYQGRSTYEY